MHWSQNFSKNHTSRGKEQTTQNSSSTVKNSKLPHLQQIANFHIFAPGKHLQFSQQIRLLAPIHFFFLSPPPLGKKKSLYLFSENQKNTWGKITDNIMLILHILILIIFISTNLDQKILLQHDCTWLENPWVCIRTLKMLLWLLLKWRLVLSGHRISFSNQIKREVGFPLKYLFIFVNFSTLRQCFSGKGPWMVLSIQLWSVENFFPTNIYITIC